MFEYIRMMHFRQYHETTDTVYRQWRCHSRTPLVADALASSEQAMVAGSTYSAGDMRTTSCFRRQPTCGSAAAAAAVADNDEEPSQDWRSVHRN